MNTESRPLRVLVACEFSGTVRNAFNAVGADAWSCDLLRSEDGSNRHFQCDVREILGNGWDLMMVAHPPCTRLCNSGVRWLNKPPTNPPADATQQEAEDWPTLSEKSKLEIMWAHLDAGAELFSAMWSAPIDRIAIENPVMHKHAKARIKGFQPAAQTVQPHWFGDEAFKATGLYLKNTPPLNRTHWMTPPTKTVEPDRHKKWSAIHHAPPGPDRWKIRSKTFAGIADAMASQWGALTPLSAPTAHQTDLFAA